MFQNRLKTIPLLVLLAFISGFSFSDDFNILPSYDKMPFGNGIGSAVYQFMPDEKISYLYDHIYQKYDPDTESRTFARRGLFWGIGSFFDNVWLSKIKSKDARYITGTGIIEIRKEWKDLEIKETYWMPMDTDERILISVIEIKNTGLLPKPVKTYLYSDMGMGGNGRRKNETVQDTGEKIIESSEGNSFITAISGLKTKDCRICYAPYREFDSEIHQQPSDIPNQITASGNNLIGIYSMPDQWLFQNQKTVRVAVFGLSIEDAGKTEKEMEKYLSMSASGLLEKELSYWNQWHQTENPNPALSDIAKDVYRHSTAVLKMGQCREEGPAYGQILASLPPGMWNISWPRDASYAINGLIDSGHFNEAEAALEFMLNAPDGEFDGEEYVGMPYKISVCRYYGNGQEWSDLNAQGPNVEFDDFGLFLWVYSKYIKETGRREFHEKYGDLVYQKVAVPLMAQMTEHGYLKPDSSIWERHWTPQNPPDGKKHFAYSTINAYRGLSELAKVDTVNAPVLNSNAQIILKGFQNHMIDQNGVIVSSIEEKERGIEYYMDASSIEALIYPGMADAVIRKANLKAYRKYLGMKETPGFLRNDDAKDYEHSWYDEQEWVVIDLRIAYAELLHGNTEEGRLLFDWVTANAENNFLLIPELLDESRQKYEGAVPMCGFGAGAYISASDLY